MHDTYVFVAGKDLQRTGSQSRLGRLMNPLGLYQSSLTLKHDNHAVYAYDKHFFTLRGAQGQRDL